MRSRKEAIRSAFDELDEALLIIWGLPTPEKVYVTCLNKVIVVVENYAAFSHSDMFENCLESPSYSYQCRLTELKINFNSS